MELKTCILVCSINCTHHTGLCLTNHNNIIKRTTILSSEQQGVFVRLVQELINISFGKFTETSKRYLKPEALCLHFAVYVMHDCTVIQISYFSRILANFVHI